MLLSIIRYTAELEIKGSISPHYLLNIWFVFCSKDKIVKYFLFVGFHKVQKFKGIFFFAPNCSFYFINPT